MAELTPLAEEADNLRSWVVEARHHANEAERALEALSARSWKDDEEATKIKKEWDMLFQKDIETHQRILDLLAEVEKERELKLGAKEKDTETHQRILNLLCKEQDELLQTTERLRSERGVAHLAPCVAGQPSRHLGSPSATRLQTSP